MSKWHKNNRYALVIEDSANGGDVRTGGAFSPVRDSANGSIDLSGLGGADLRGGVHIKDSANGGDVTTSGFGSGVSNSGNGTIKF